MNYFNVLAGCWEPAIEDYHLAFNYFIRKDESWDMTLKMEKEININMSENLLSTIKVAMKSY